MEKGRLGLCKKKRNFGTRLYNDQNINIYFVIEKNRTLFATIIIIKQDFMTFYAIFSKTKYRKIQCF